MHQRDAVRLSPLQDHLRYDAALAAAVVQSETRLSGADLTWYL